MIDKVVRSSLFHWYREAIEGNPGPIVTLSRAVETFYLFELASDDLYHTCCYLMDNLIEIGILDYNKNIIGKDVMEQEELPFPDADIPEMEELPFA